VRDSEAALGSRPAIMHALRSVLSVCSVSALPGATVTTTTVRALSACRKSYQSSYQPAICTFFAAWLAAGCASCGARWF